MAGNFNLDDYIQVNDRIKLFYERYPEGSIQTELLTTDNGQAIFKAYAYKTPNDERPATGHAMEKEGSTFINKTSHIENCETSAIGRALAIMGFGISKSVASREEVENARLQQEMLKEKISEVKTKVITDLITETGTDLKNLLAHYKVKAIADLNAAQAADCQAKLLAKKNEVK